MAFPRSVVKRWLPTAGSEDDRDAFFESIGGGYILEPLGRELGVDFHVESGSAIAIRANDMMAMDEAEHYIGTALASTVRAFFLPFLCLVSSTPGPPFCPLFRN